MKHGWKVWACVLGCLLRDLFPGPEAVLYLTGTTQAEFVQEFSVFILESLIGTEAHSKALSRAQTREDLLSSLRYRRSSGTLSKKPPSRVELLIEMLSPWATISYGGCRFLRVARAETVRKIRAVNQYYAAHCDDNLVDTVLNIEISRDQQDYVLFHLSMEECLHQPWSVIRAIPLHRWADQPGNPCPIPDLKEH